MNLRSSIFCREFKVEYEEGFLKVEEQYYEDKSSFNLVSKQGERV